MSFDCDAPLTFERVGVHDSFGYDLIISKRARLAEHLVDEGGLPVIDVRDDGNITDRHSLVV